MEWDHGDKAWQDIISFPRPDRSRKPRYSGVTMVIDKGLGLTEFRDMLELASDYIDMIKLTFGTPAFYPTELLREKCRICRAFGADIFPGGTFLEIAVLQGKLGRYLRRAQELGFNAVEVSDGTVPMSPETRAWSIKSARDLGFRVITEVGKKNPADVIPPAAMIEQIARDHELGASYVIVEGRESGKGVGIYESDGRVKADDLEYFIRGVRNPEFLIWEAPLKNQQQSLIFRLGTNVNLGNIPPSDIVALEALRVGLRGDTLRESLKGFQEAVPMSLRKE